MDVSWISIVEDAVVPVGVAVGSYFLGRYDRERSRKERYQITTTRWQPYGLRLDIRYTPASAHATIIAKLGVKEPGVRLIAGRPVLNPAPMATGGYTRFEFDGQFIGNEGQVTLRPYDSTETLSGVMFLVPDGIHAQLLRKTPITLTIAEAEGRTLLKRKLTVSPVDENANAVFAMPPPLNPIAFG